MANSMLTPKVYANTFLKLLQNNVVLPKLVSSQYKDIVVNPISKTGQSNGTTVYIKRPRCSPSATASVASVQDVVEGEIAVTIDKQKGVDVEFTSLEETLTVDGLLKSKVMQAKASALANQIDQDLHAETRSSSTGSARRAPRSQPMPGSSRPRNGWTKWPLNKMAASVFCRRRTPGA